MTVLCTQQTLVALVTQNSGISCDFRILLPLRVQRCKSTIVWIKVDTSWEVLGFRGEIHFNPISHSQITPIIGLKASDYPIYTLLEKSDNLRNPIMIGLLGCMDTGSVKRAYMSRFYHFVWFYQNFTQTIVHFQC